MKKNGINKTPPERKEMLCVQSDMQSNLMKTKDVNKRTATSYNNRGHICDLYNCPIGWQVNGKN